MPSNEPWPLQVAALDVAGEDTVVAHIAAASRYTLTRDSSKGVEAPQGAGCVELARVDAPRSRSRASTRSSGEAPRMRCSLNEPRNLRVLQT